MLKELFELYAAFFRVGLFTFGGGYAMLPLIQREVVDKKGWADENEVMDYFAVGQCTPGVIAVNVATFIGSKRKGVIGGIAATLGVVAPSIIIISIIAAFLSHFADNPYVGHAFNGIRLAVCALVSVSIFKLFKKGVVDAVTAGIAVATFLCLKLFGVSPVAAVVVSAVAGVVFRCVIQKKISSKEKGASTEDKPSDGKSEPSENGKEAKH